MNTFKRRKFLQTLVTASAVAGAGNISVVNAQEKKQIIMGDKNRFKISLNAYSFNAPLTKGTTNLDAVMEFCANRIR